MGKAEAVILCFRKRFKSGALKGMTYDSAMWFQSRKDAKDYMAGTEGRDDLDWDYDLHDEGHKILGWYGSDVCQAEALKDFSAWN